MSQFRTVLGEFREIVVQGVVSEHDDEYWGPLTWNPGMIISNYGKTAREFLNGDIKAHKPAPWKTTKGFYWTAPGVMLPGSQGFSPNGRGSIHRAVCYVFNGPPAEEDMDVNHKDGNKLNNHYKNLEWASRSDNVLHAFKEGLADTGVTVELKSLKTGKIEIFNGFNGAARFLGVDKGSIIRQASASKENPYLGEWVINVRRAELKPGQHKHLNIRKVELHDRCNGSVRVLRDSTEVALELGVSQALVSMNCKKDGSGLVKGYSMRYAGEDRPWPPLDDREVDKSLRKREKTSRAIDAINLSTGETRIFDSIKIAVRELGCLHDTVDRDAVTATARIQESGWIIYRNWELHFSR